MQLHLLLYYNLKFNLKIYSSTFKNILYFKSTQISLPIDASKQWSIYKNIQVGIVMLYFSNHYRLSIFKKHYAEYQK